MLNKVKISKLNSLLLLSGLGLSIVNHGISFDEIDHIFADFHEDIMRMEQRMFDRLNKDNLKNHSAQNIKADIKEDGDYIVVALDLPNKIGDNSITIEAKQNSLKGSVAVAGCSVKFNVANNGRTFSYTCSNSSDEKTDQSERYFASETYHQVMLPTPVENLENAQINRDSKTLIIRLPKVKAVQEHAAGWKKLTVK